MYHWFFQWGQQLCGRVFQRHLSFVDDTKGERAIHRHETMGMLLWKNILDMGEDDIQIDPNSLRINMRVVMGTKVNK